MPRGPDSSRPASSLYRTVPESWSILLKAPVHPQWWRQTLACHPRSELYESSTMVTMSRAGARSKSLQTQSDDVRLEFLRMELATGFTLASLAETERQLGENGAAARCLELAEKAYSTVAGYLSDEKHSKYITDDRRRQLETGMRRLRETLSRHAEIANDSSSNTRHSRRP